MNKPRIFLGSSGEQAKLLGAIEKGLSDVADVEPWTTTFNPGRSTLDRTVVPTTVPPDYSWPCLVSVPGTPSALDLSASHHRPRVTRVSAMAGA